MNFSDELNKYMNLLNCSAKDICNISGLSPALLSRYLNNKRAPKSSSIYVDKIINAIYEIAQSNNIDITQEEISATLRNSLNTNSVDYDVFIENFNTLQEDLKFSTVELSKALGYDSSFLSRIKNKERHPSDFDNFVDKLASYVISSCNSSDKRDILLSLMKCTDNNSVSDAELKKYS